jgi:hypothetical protein
MQRNKSSIGSNFGSALNNISLGSRLNMDNQQRIGENDDESEEDDDDEDDDVVKGLSSGPAMPMLSKTQSMVMPQMSKPPEIKPP